MKLREFTRRLGVLGVTIEPKYKDGGKTGYVLRKDGKGDSILCLGADSRTVNDEALRYVSRELGIPRHVLNAPSSKKFAVAFANMARGSRPR